MDTLAELLVALFGPCLLVLVSGGVFGGTPQPVALANLGVSPILTIIAVVLHELGHALVAKLVGLDVVRIQIGIGRRLLARRFAGVRVIVNALPLNGRCFLGAPNERWLRTRVWLAVAAGPATNIALACLVARWPVPLTTEEMLLPGMTAIANFAPRHLFMVINALLAFGNLIPIALEGRGVDTDGANLLTLPFATTSRVREYLSMRNVMACLDHLETSNLVAARQVIRDALVQHPQAFRLRHLQASLSEAGDMRRSREQLLALAGEAPTKRDARVIDNAVAWFTFWMRDTDFRDEANRMSLRAHQAMKKMPFVIATRALMLTWMGRAPEAKKLLGAARLAASGPQERNAVTCATAITYAGLGDAPQAEQWLARARALNINLALVTLAERIVRETLLQRKPLTSDDETSSRRANDSASHDPRQP